MSGDVIFPLPQTNDPDCALLWGDFHTCQVRDSVREAELRAALCGVSAGHGRPGALPDHHHGLLQGSHGIRANVRHHQPGVLLRCARLVGKLRLTPMNVPSVKAVTYEDPDRQNSATTLRPWFPWCLPLLLLLLLLPVLNSSPSPPPASLSLAFPSVCRRVDPMLDLISAICWFAG